MGEYKTIDSFIAELKSSNFFKDNPHLIDESSIYRWVNMALKKFGTNIMDKRESVSHINNYKGTTPSDFGKIALAVYCEPYSCHIKGSKEKVLQSRVWVDRVETEYAYDRIYFNDVCEFENCHKDCECKNRQKSTNHIVEKLSIDLNDYHFHYRNPQYVKLGRDVIRESCMDACINRGVKDSPYSINIKGQMIYANFRKGAIYMEYYGLPQDEDGVPIIPHSQNGYLEEYIEYNVKRKILEDAIMSKDASNLITMFQFYNQKENELYERAISDTSPLNMKSFWKAISVRRKDMAKYNINLG